MKKLNNKKDASIVNIHMGSLGSTFASQKLYVSSSGSDTREITLRGGSTIDTIILDGTNLVETTESFTSLFDITADAVATDRIVYVRFAGVAAKSNVVLYCDNVTPEHEITLGTSLASKKYKFKNALAGSNSAQVSTLTAIADVSGSLNNKYFDIYDATPTPTTSADSTGGIRRVWFNVGGAGSTPTPTTGVTFSEVTFATDATNIQVATAIESVVHALSTFNASRVDEVVTITASTNGYRNPINAGTSGMSVVTTVPGETTQAPNDVLIGADSDETMENLTYAINADPDHTSVYGASTTANATFTAENTNSVITLTDKVRAVRVEAYVSTFTVGSELFITPISGSITGTFLASLPANYLFLQPEFDYSEEDFDEATQLPSGVSLSSNFISVSSNDGSNLAFYVAIQGDWTAGTYNVVLSYYLKITGFSLVFPGSTTMNIAIDSADTKYVFFPIEEPVENISLTISNTDVASVPIKIFAGLVIR